MTVVYVVSVTFLFENPPHLFGKYFGRLRQKKKLKDKNLSFIKMSPSEFKHLTISFLRMSVTYFRNKKLLVEI